MNDNNAQKAFKESVDSVIETTLTGTTSRKVELISTITFTVGRETFSTEEVNVKQHDSEGNQKAIEKCDEHEK